MPRKDGPLIADIADRAGVSKATVDRVLNGRSGVHVNTVERVLEAATKVGYLTRGARARYRIPMAMRLVFLLPSGTNPYLGLLGQTLKEAASHPPDPGLKIECLFIDSFDPKSLSLALRRHGERADGVAFMAIDHPEVAEATALLRENGKHVVSLVSDISGRTRSAYVGLDNRAVGRTAAHLLGRMCGHSQGKVALIAASRAYRVHAERETGFLALLEESFPGLKVADLREGHDQRDENYHHTLALLSEYRDLLGIYNLGGSSDGIARALRDRGRAEDVFFIGHGLTRDTRRLLLDDTLDVVITQDPDQLVRRALQTFIDLREGSRSAAEVAPITMQIVTKENLPSQ